MSLRNRATISYGLMVPILGFSIGYQIFGCSFDAIEKRLGRGRDCPEWGIDAMYQCALHPQIFLLVAAMLGLSFWFWKSEDVRSLFAFAPLALTVIGAILLVAWSDAGCFNSLIAQGKIEPTSEAMDAMRNLLRDSLPPFSLLLLLASPLLAIIVAIWTFLAFRRATDH